MSEISAAAELSDPDGLSHTVYPGWVGDDPEQPLIAIETMAGPLPRHFHVDYVIEDVAGILTLEWEIEEGDRLRLARASVVGASENDELEDVAVALTRLRKLWGPDNEWRRATIRWLVATVKNIETVGRYKREGRPLPSGGAYERSAAEEASLKNALDAAEGLSEAPRRDRITSELLRDVAFIYRQAHADGRRPTQAVAQHFGKPRSTAGRWVGMARQVGYLGPATGPRAGEAEATEVDDDG